MKSGSEDNQLDEVARDIRKSIVRMHAKSDASHIASSLSCVDILVALFFNILNIKPDDPRHPGRDRFILSKGHAVSSLYATLAKKGFFDGKVLEEYCTDGGRLLGHSTRDAVPGVEVSTGSLGHGLALGAGMALAGRYDNLGYRVFVLLSDGECNEGSTWEAALFASQHKLEKLVAVVDYNKLQAYGRTHEVMNLEPFADKWRSFGWVACEVNGHNIGEITKALENTQPKRGCPTVVIAHTVKGKGVSFMEDKLEWHYRSPKKEDLELALEELGGR